MKLGWLPAGGFPGWGESVSGSLKSLILPAIALALVQASVLTRYIRSAILEVLREDFMRTRAPVGSPATGRCRTNTGCVTRRFRS